MVMYVLVLGLFASATSERVLVVTPQSRLPENDERFPLGDDSYLEAYRDAMRGTVSDRRNPSGLYEESYNTLGHSSFVEDDAYPELNLDATHLRKPQSHHHHHHHHRHPSLAVPYGPSTPLSNHHHNHHHHHQREPEHISSHHTAVDIFPPFHFVTDFLHKFGLYKVVNILAKIAVLAVILKFITVVAIFLVLPAFVPQNKEKEDADDDDGILKSLGAITDRVWNGIAAREKMEVFDRRENHRKQQGNQTTSEPEIHQKPPQHAMHQDKDKDKDMCKDKDKNKCREKDKDKCKEKEKENDEGELDPIDMKLVKKIIKQWKEENFGGPDKSSAISFLRNCVSTVNRFLAIALGYLKMKNGNMDVLDGMMLHHFSLYMKDLVKVWHHVVSDWKG